MEHHLLAIKNKNKELCKKTDLAKKVAQQAIQAGASLGAQVLRIEKKLQDRIFLLEENQSAPPCNDLNFADQLRDLCSNLVAVQNWRNIWADRIESLELDMRDEDGLLLSQLSEIRNAVAAGDSGAFSAGGHTIINEEAVLPLISTLPGRNNYTVL